MKRRQEGQKKRGDVTTEAGVNVREKFEDAKLLAFKMGNGTTSQGMQPAHSRWKR